MTNISLLRDAGNKQLNRQGNCQSPKFGEGKYLSNLNRQGNCQSRKFEEGKYLSNNKINQHEHVRKNLSIHFQTKT